MIQYLDKQTDTIQIDIVKLEIHTHLHQGMHDSRMLQAIQTDADSEAVKSTYQNADSEVKN